MVRAATKALNVSPDAVGGPQGLRERMLALAGVDEAEQARATRRAITKLCDLLSAQKVTHVVVNNGRSQGEVRDFVDEDLGRQHAAAVELLDRFGVVVGKGSQSLNVGGNLTVIISKREPPAAVDGRGDEVVEGEVVKPT